MRGNRSELASGRKLPQCHVNMPPLRVYTMENCDRFVKQIALAIIIVVIIIIIIIIIIIVITIITIITCNILEGPLQDVLDALVTFQDVPDLDPTHRQH